MKILERFKIDRTRVRQVKNWLKENGEEISFEGGYRAYHNSYKIHYLRFGSLQLLNLCFYVLGLVSLDLKSWEEEKLIDNAKDLVKKGTFTRKIVLSIIKDDLPWEDYYHGRIPWIPITPSRVTRYFGYYCFFKTLLIALIKYIENKRYEQPYFRCITPYEGLVEYFLADLSV